MRAFTQARSGVVVWFWPAVLCLAAGWAQPAPAQLTPSDSWEEIRQLLKAPERASAERQLELARRLEALNNLNDLGQVLLLPEWHEQESDDDGTSFDQATWRALADHFVKEERAALHGDDVVRQVAAAELLGELGVRARALGRRLELVRDLGPDLALLMRQGRGAAAEVAARNLGLINPDPEVAVPALKGLLEADSTELRLAAAEGLCQLMHGAASLALAHLDNDKSRTLRAHAALVGCLLVPVAGRGLCDVHPAVRFRCVEAMREAASTVAALVLDTNLPDDPDERKEYRLEIERERGALAPVVLALEAQGPALGLALTDPDADVRLCARHVLEELAQARHRLLLRAKSLAAVAPGNRPPQMLEGEKLESAGLPLPALIAALGDPDVAARLWALEVLESLGPPAAPAAAAVVKALTDPNRFVRWAAARTLATIGVVEVETAVPALARMLADADKDLRLAAATTLGVYGPTARAAVPALIQAMNGGDSALRAAALLALEQVGPAAEPAIPAISAALNDRDARVRQSAARLLGRFGPTAGNARDALRLKLNDTSPDVRTTAQDALLHIIGPAHSD
jgi:HEAT repeat protein